MHWRECRELKSGTRIMISGEEGDHELCEKVSEFLWEQGGGD